MSVHWRLSQAIAWIADRNEEVVAAAPEAVTILMLEYAYEWNGSSAREAKAELWAALEAGKITATGITPDGERRPIAPERWRDLNPTLYGKTETLQRPGFHPGTTYEDVIVASAAVRKEWPVGDTAVPAPELKNLREQVAAIIGRQWPKGKPEGMKVKDYENAIVTQVKTETGSTISTRTVKRAIKLAK